MKYLSGGDIIDEKVTDKYGVVTVKIKNMKRKILFVKEDGDWKIDLFKLERFWKRGSNLDKMK